MLLWGPSPRGFRQPFQGWIYNLGGLSVISPISRSAIHTLLSVLQTFPSSPTFKDDKHLRPHSSSNNGLQYHFRSGLLRLLPCCSLLSERLRPLLYDHAVASRERLYLPILRAHPQPQPPEQVLYQIQKVSLRQDFGRALNNCLQCAVFDARPPNIIQYPHKTSSTTTILVPLLSAPWRDPLLVSQPSMH